MSKATKPVLNVIATVLSFFTLPVAAAGSTVAVRTGQETAGGSAKLLPQFTKSTIDDAVNRVMKIENDVRHIFENTTHNLGPLVNRLGGRENTIRAVLNAANGRLPANGGIFTNLPINVGGQTVILRGRVVNGVPRISTMFIP